MKALRRWAAVVSLLALLALLAGCTQATEGTHAGNPRSDGARRLTGSSEPSPSPSASPTGTALPARFVGTVSGLPSGLANRMRGTIWHPGCPVPLSDLRLLTLRYWGSDGVVHRGLMVVNERVATGVVSVFRKIFAARFPIRLMHLAVRYVPGHDDPNDDRDYTAGFNCRPVVTAFGAGTSWSMHAYGLAIDINPIENPYVAASGYVHNNFARPYRNRFLHRPGMVLPGDIVVRAFASIGWKWAGYWSSNKDYMHFSSNGQ